MAGKNTLKSMFKEYFNIIGMVKKLKHPFSVLQYGGPKLPRLQINFKKKIHKYKNKITLLLLLTS